jgi:L,D-peptidoglycan transpeptidase YkuD (ErfK/YbiS/YcfS/YnhG family)
VLWIDTNGSDPSASALDVEPGDATPSGASQRVKEKLSAQPNGVAIVYTMRSEWQAVKDAIGSLPASMPGKVRYWIADPTGVNHNVAGASATQWYWGTTTTSRRRTPASNSGRQHSREYAMLWYAGRRRKTSSGQAPLAQSAERLHGKEKVYGSIP